VSSNPTGEVRPRSHRWVPKQARTRLPLPRERVPPPASDMTLGIGMLDQENAFNARTETVKQRAEILRKRHDRR